ncbi:MULTISPECIES: HNH endonuclease signature motif containing protein [unclassified Lacrimispora]|uniref:HNH endonuclease signature motif containing protein n=1 Tax=unclassified Lacrimispora TaxID=2719232 RepID=UPI0037704246
MRPVDKGISPYTEIDVYQDAKPYLEEKVGKYCSFCEMHVTNALAVEHKESKNSGGALKDWDNLLLGCTYCNSRKSEKIKKGDLDKWLWPDKHNTFLAFTYEGAVPKVNEEYLKTVSDEALKRAEQLFSDIELDYQPGKGEDEKKIRDKRWENRFETLSIAETTKSTWLMLKNEEDRNSQIVNIVNMAKGYGFFSIWMMVFKEYDIIKRALITAFPGTSRSCFDKNGNPVQRLGEIL